MLPFHFIVRFFRTNRSINLINLLGLSIGFTAAILIGLFVNHELTVDNFHPIGDRVYRLINSMSIGGSDMNSQSGSSFTTGPALATEVEGIEKFCRIAMAPGNYPVRYNDISFLEDKIFHADSTFFQMFGFKLVKGEADQVLNRPFTAVLTQSTAEKYFGNENPIGKELVLNDVETYEVTGVVEDQKLATHFPEYPMILSWSSLGYDDNSRSWMNGMTYVTFFLLEEGVTPESIQDQIDASLYLHIGKRLEESGTGTWLKLFLEPLRDAYLIEDHASYNFKTGSMEMVKIFVAIGLFILVIASLNFINLTTARATKRGRQVGITKVLGSTRSQLISNFLAESIIVALVAMIIASFLAFSLLQNFNNLLDIHILPEVFINPVVLGIMALSAVLLGLIAGIYPAFQLSAFQPIEVLKGQLRTGKKGRKLRGILVTLQFTISIVLLISALLIYRQMSYMRNYSSKHSYEQVVSLKLSNENLMAQHENIRNDMMNIPGVKSSCTGDFLPNAMSNYWVRIVPDSISDKSIVFNIASFGYDYLDLFDINVVQGRNFSRDIPSDSTDAILINQSAVELLGWDNPIGKQICTVRSRNPYLLNYKTVIGVVEDFHTGSMRYQIRPMHIEVNTGNPRFIFLRLEGNAISSSMEQIQHAWKQYSPNIPLNYSFLDEVYDFQYRYEAKLMKLINIFTFIALFIAGIGLYALAAFAAEQRTREISVRKVLGASLSNLSMLLTRNFMIMVVIANLIAWPIAWYVMSKWLDTYSYRPDFAWWIFPVSGIAALVVALATVISQAIHTALLNPAEVLKSE